MEKTKTLQATIGLPQAVALYIGAVLGSGVLLVPGLAAEIAGPASLLAWGLMTLLILPMALSMGLLAAKFPSAGGVSHFVSRAFGDRAGTVVGWFFLMAVPVGTPITALIGAGYLSVAMGWGESARLTVAVIMLLVGLLTNLLGMKVAGSIQVTVVAAIVAVLLLAIAGAAPNIEARHFTPFLSNGWYSVGQATAIIFWCFIGWEAVSHLSEEFVDPEREAVKGVTIAAIVVGLLYFLTALATVGTHTYGQAGLSETSLALVIEGLLGKSGIYIAGFTGVFICMATIIAYVGATSRLAYALAQKGDAPKLLGALSKKHGTPVGGLAFLAVCFVIVLALYATDSISLSTLIQFPNATIILTYLGGCAAGIRLLKGNKWGVRLSWLSFVLTALIFPFVGWAMLYPLLILAIVWLSGLRKGDPHDLPR
ncbi:L-methionine/branched-chain amino acid transporter [Tumebacillus algifaecis]|uniref:L-methionine/branched-chain amino acid transporter n=1 Tax=Tumebacillus algifaecis TaxID=1214604 RepID=A0A223D291_9BACL|nr:L-methionine/branched-chain amino acid transporter [Tumebacillus algifaecis]ASS75553.1 L-methionine/branched-chain amino acid transporter [Tumebacillus algifaecis]